MKLWVKPETALAVVHAKENSKRVPRKNLEKIGDKSLVAIALQRCLAATCFHAVVLDTEFDEVLAAAKADLPHIQFTTGELPSAQEGALPLATTVHIFKRDPVLATNDTNGNELLTNLVSKSGASQFDMLFQIQSTSPFLSPESIRQCVEKLKKTEVHDCIMTVVPLRGYLWGSDGPNYNVDEIPNSGDMSVIYKETQGLYGITTAALLTYRRRIGALPIFHVVEEKEAIDIDWPGDLEKARTHV